MSTNSCKRLSSESGCSVWCRIAPLQSTRQEQRYDCRDSVSVKTHSLSLDWLFLTCSDIGRCRSVDKAFVIVPKSGLWICAILAQWLRFFQQNHAYTPSFGFSCAKFHPPSPVELKCFPHGWGNNVCDSDWNKLLKRANRWEQWP